MNNTKACKAETHAEPRRNALSPEDALSLRLLRSLLERNGYAQCSHLSSSSMLRLHPATATQVPPRHFRCHARSFSAIGCVV